MTLTDKFLKGFLCPARNEREGEDQISPPPIYIPGFDIETNKEPAQTLHKFDRRPIILLLFIFYLFLLYKLLLYFEVQETIFFKNST